MKYPPQSTYKKIKQNNKKKELLISKEALKLYNTVIYSNLNFPV